MRTRRRAKVTWYASFIPERDEALLAALGAVSSGKKPNRVRGETRYVLAARAALLGDPRYWGDRVLSLLVEHEEPLTLDEISMRVSGLSAYYAIGSALEECLWALVDVGRVYFAYDTAGALVFRPGLSVMRPNWDAARERLAARPYGEEPS